jgi:hypothetical protein
VQPEKAVGSVLIYVRNADAIGGVGEGGGGGGERSGGKGSGGAAGDERGAVRIRQLSAATEIALLHEKERSGGRGGKRQSRGFGVEGAASVRVWCVRVC